MKEYDDEKYAKESDQTEKEHRLREWLDTKKLAEIINIPVICIGGIKKYEQADFILKNSKIEYIAMSRELLKQPDIVKKWVLNK